MAEQGGRGSCLLLVLRSPVARDEGGSKRVEATSGLNSFSP